MVSRYGDHFERKAILKWLAEGNNYCPVTNNPLRPQNLISDKNLQWKIQYWAKKNGCAEKVAIDEEEDDFMIMGVIPHDHLICPLTKEVMKDPVMTKHNINFERAAILRHLDVKGTKCPVTGKNLLPSDLVSNHKLKWEIDQWQLHHGEAYDELAKLELESKLTKATMISQGYGTSDILRALAMEESKRAGITPGTKTEKKPTTTEDILDCLDDVVDTVET